MWLILASQLAVRCQVWQRIGWIPKAYMLIIRILSNNNQQPPGINCHEVWVFFLPQFQPFLSFPKMFGLSANYVTTLGKSLVHQEGMTARSTMAEITSDHDRWGRFDPLADWILLPSRFNVSPAMVTDPNQPSSHDLTLSGWFPTWEAVGKWFSKWLEICDLQWWPEDGKDMPNPKTAQTWDIAYFARW